MFTRTDTSLLGRWWWTVDRLSLSAMLSLILLGSILMMAATPLIATKLNLSAMHFVKRHFTLMPIGLAALISISALRPIEIRRLAMLILLASLALMACTPFMGAEIKGAKRWISLGGFSLQASEFMKPAFIVTSAWFLAKPKNENGLQGWVFSLAIYACIVALLLMQPDFGMVVVVTTIWLGQLFLYGLPMQIVWLSGGASLLIALGSYFFLPHVASRINRFLDPAAGDRYQIHQSLDAFMQGGFWGTGPGEGTVKRHLPDAHADFIFAVVGEEFGFIMCFLIVCIFIFIAIRGMLRVYRETNLFIFFAVSGLMMQFGMQAFINMGSTLHLLPTKGMTLPFMSYGGSSFIAMSIGMGMALGLTRRRLGLRDDDQV